MPLHPQSVAFLKAFEARGGPPLHTLSPAEARRVSAARMTPAPPVETARVEELSIPGPAGDLRARLFRPSLDPGLPVLVFLHGGGWVLGGAGLHEPSCARVANESGAMVLTVDYRLAPEHKFPSALEDCYTAVRWVVDEAPRIGADPARVAVGGESAGASLAAGVALLARDRDWPSLAFLFLAYPATDPSCGSASAGAFAAGHLLTRAGMRWAWGHYLRGEEDLKNPYAALATNPKLEGLPPTLLITAEFDPLRDEGEAFAARLREAGVAVACRRYDGVIHGFFTFPNLFDAAREAHADAAAALRAALRPKG